MAKGFYTPTEIDLIKQTYRITDYLSAHNYEPEYYKKGEWYYSSIGVKESTPSFRVNATKNVYQDYSGNQDNTGKCGDIIRLVMSLEHCDFIDACNRLSVSEFAPFAKVVDNVKPTEKNCIEIESVNAIQSKSLINYLNNRCISLKLATMYLSEVNYTNDGNSYSSLGFKNDLGGYALRSPPTKFNSKGFKGQTRPNYYTTLLPHSETTVCNIFEGFFSALSCLEIYERLYFDNLTYVLNSVTANLLKLLPNIPEHIEQINLFLDNDSTGRKYTQKVIDLDRWHVVDQSGKYAGCKDYNEYLINQ